MGNIQETILLAELLTPKRTLRPVRRNSPEYLEMVASIRVDGVLQPILVRPTPEGFEIVEGNHRVEASKEAGMTTIPALVREMTDEEVLVAQLKCQAIRPKTATFEYARRLKLLMECGLTLNQLSNKISKSPKWIRDQLHLGRLCEEAREPVENGEMAMTSALALANLPTDLQAKFIEEAITLNTKEFLERAKAALRDFKAYLRDLQQEDKKIGAALPELRVINVLKREAVKPKRARHVIKAMKAKTASQGWEACLAWIFKLDPITVGKRKETYDKNERKMNTAEWHQTNRDMMDKFVKHQSSTGDYRNVKE